MNKNLIALAALAFAGAASAQTSGSSVTLWGVVDADIGHYSLGSQSKTMASSSGGNAGSQLGFRGTEDLGGGMSANFWLEMQLSNQTGGAGGAGFNGGTLGSSLFNRRSTVSLAGNFGEVRLGRDYTPSFMNHYIFDPFRDSGPGAGTNITLGGANALAVGGANVLGQPRASNSIQYLWGFQPNALAVLGSGVYGQLMYAFPGNANGQPALGEYAGGRIGYSNGPLNVALSYAESKGLPYAPDALPAGNGYSTFKESNLGGWYNFGVATVMAHYGVNNSDVAQTKFTHWGVGATINAGPGYIPIAYNRIKQNNATSDGADQWAVGYVYNLSKRTSLYAAVSHLSNKNNGLYNFNGSNGGANPGFAPASAANPGGFTPGSSGTGYDIGIRTFF
ncbi:MAG: Outer membrane porin protein 32 precursor [Burkholderiaceae bacterium]|jgi:predicted porin|nr:MAG: Outer membrane porin protein 32 precursor [Burkholderiaceae bacterium]